MKSETTGKAKWTQAMLLACLTSSAKSKNDCYVVCLISQCIQNWEWDAHVGVNGRV